MTTLGQLRKAALSNPEAVEGDHDAAGTFSVAGQVFARLDPDRNLLLRLSEADADDMAAQHATSRVAGHVSLPLADINGQEIYYWVHRAWLECAPESLARRAVAARNVKAGEVGDLPRAIGRPATRALVNADITTLDQVAGLSDAELLAMHGVGPRAVKLLREALDRR